MTCQRRLAGAAGWQDLASASSSVSVIRKLPLIPRYEPVPDPATIGAAAATLMKSDYARGEIGSWLAALTKA